MPRGLVAEWTGRSFDFQTNFYASLHKVTLHRRITCDRGLRLGCKQTASFFCGVVTFEAYST